MKTFIMMPTDYSIPGTGLHQIIYYFNEYLYSYHVPNRRYDVVAEISQLHHTNFTSSGLWLFLACKLILLFSSSRWSRLKTSALGNIGKSWAPFHCYDTNFVFLLLYLICINISVINCWNSYSVNMSKFYPSHMQFKLQPP